MTARLEIKRIENIVRLMDWRMEVLSEVSVLTVRSPAVLSMKPISVTLTTK